jgi:hypothetical protein
MVIKKKAVEEKNYMYQCQVPGCGLVCPDDVSMSRHMNLAHPNSVPVENKKQISNSRRKNN